jgi:hypothetical protein
MGLDLPSFADAEEVAYSLLTPLGNVVKGTPVQIVTPVYIIRRIGGHSDYITDYPQIQVTAIGDKRPQSVSMQLAAQRVIENAFATEVTLFDNSVVLIDGTMTLTSGHIQPYENMDLREVVGIYELRLRRPIVAAH